MERNTKSLPIPQERYSDLSVSDYTNLFTSNNIIGGSLNDIILFEKDNYSNLFRKDRRGAGFFSFLSSLAKKSLPYLKKYVLPEALNVTSSLLSKSQSAGEKSLTKKDLEHLGKRSLRNIASKALTGSGKSSKGKKNIFLK